jgi:hypothetical protein
MKLEHCKDKPRLEPKVAFGDRLVSGPREDVDKLLVSI